MQYLTFPKSFNNSKLFFSKNELTKILSCYSLGVSKGRWKDYAINYHKNEVNFFIFKHTLASPVCILTKSIKSNKSNKSKNLQYIYDLEITNKNKNKFSQIDDLLASLKRKQLKVIIS